MSIKIKLAIYDSSLVRREPEKDLFLADVTVECQESTRIHHIAKEILRSKAFREQNEMPAETKERGKLTICVIESPGSGAREKLLDPESLVSRSGLLSGDSIGLIYEFNDSFLERPIPTVGEIVLSKTSGIISRHSLLLGNNTLGRTSLNRIVVNDKSISRRHLNIQGNNNAIFVKDSGSANGILFKGKQVPGLKIESPTEILIGDVYAKIVPSTAGRFDFQGTEIISLHNNLYNPPPVFIERPKKRVVTLPTPPEEDPRTPFSWVSLVLPVVMGAGIYAVTGSLYSLIFVFLGPTMVVGSWAEKAWARKNKNRTKSSSWRSAFDHEKAVLTKMKNAEQKLRQALDLKTKDLYRAAFERSKPLWTRRACDTEFLELTIGRGTGSSYTEAKVPEKNLADKEKWSELEKFASGLKTVPDVPIFVNLENTPVFGVAGEAEKVHGMLRTLAVQIITLHSPQTIVLASPIGETLKYLNWSPHADRRVHIGDLEARINGGHNASENALKFNSDLRHTILFVEDFQIDAATRARLLKIARNGEKSRIHVIWATQSESWLPNFCSQYVTLQGRKAESVNTERTERVTLTNVELTTDSLAQQTTKTLAGLQDYNLLSSDDLGIPVTISLLDIQNLNLSGGVNSIINLWEKNDSSHSLNAVVGYENGHTVEIDLRADGPHALVGGTTGAGKSEFLQTWIAALASANSPKRLNFLLIDYKGGASFADCTSLPHTVGLVTDLTVGLAGRVLVSIRAELRAREELFNEFKVKDLHEFEEKYPTHAPPSLVIIVDEFATLVAEVPEFVDGMVDIAQRGRSLGIHLILATQRPAGVIKDNVRANTNIRVALRVAEPSESSEIIGTKDASLFSYKTPGRAAIKVGSQNPLIFQAAYVGGPITGLRQETNVLLHDLHTGEPLNNDKLNSRLKARHTEEKTELQIIAERTKEAFKALRIRKPRKPWQEPLAETISVKGFFQQNLSSSGLHVPFGLLDRPSQQKIEVAFFDLAEFSNAAIFGAPGSGKTTAIKTIFFTATKMILGSTFYIIDAPGQDLKNLASVGNVAVVAPHDDNELVAKTLTKVLQILEKRENQRALEKNVTFAPVFLMIDDFGSFRDHTEKNFALHIHQQKIVEIMRRGKTVSVHTVLTADRSAAVPSNFLAHTQKQLVLKLLNDHEYDFFDVPKGKLFDSAPGRGVFGGETDELQVFNTTAADIETLANSPIKRAERISKAPEKMFLEELNLFKEPSTNKREGDNKVYIGIEVDTLFPKAVVKSGIIVISGGTGAGVRSAAQTLIDEVSTSLKQLGGNLLVQVIDVEQENALESLNGLKLIKGDPQIVILCGVETLTDLKLQQETLRIFKQMRKETQNLLIVLHRTGPGTIPFELLNEMRHPTWGLALRYDGTETNSPFKLPPDSLKTERAIPGRGFLISDREKVEIQVALTRPSLLGL